MEQRSPAEEGFRGKRELVETLLETSGDWIWAMDPQGTIMYSSPAVEELLGYRVNEIVGRSSLPFMHPDDRKNVEPLHDRWVAEKRGWRGLVLRWRHRDGSWRHLESNGVPLLDSGGELHGFQGVDRDVTEREQVRMKLELSEERFRSLVEHTTESIFCYEYDPPVPTDIPVDEQVKLMYGGVLAECNDVCARSYGATEAREVVGKRLTELFGTTSGSLDAFFRRFIGSGYQIAGSESVEVLSDGAKRYYLNSGHATIESGGLVRVWGAYRDITDRKRTEEALRASESRFRALVEQAGDAFFLHTMDGRIIDANHQACRSLGYTREELLSMTVADIDVPAEGSQHKEKFWDKLAPGLFTTLEGRHRRKDGSTFPVEVRLGVIEIGNTPHMLGLARDISDRRGAEEELAKTQALLSAAVEQTPAGIILADAPDVRIRVANSAALGIRGEATELLTDIPMELHPQRWQTYYPDGSPVPPEDLPLSQAVLKGKTSRNVEVIIRREGGEDRWVLANAAPVRNQQGEVIAGVVVFPDVTDLKHAEEAIRRERERAQIYLDIAEVVLIALDESERITMINRKGRDLLGYEESELLGKNWFDLCLPGADRERTRKVFRSLMSGDVDPARYHENLVLTKAGDERLVAWHNAVVRDHDGRVVATFGSGEDITERRRMQEAMIQTEKMMTVGGLAAGMAHEINSPLSGILQGVENSLRRVSPKIGANKEAAAACGIDLGAMNAYLERRGVLSFLSGVQEAGVRAARIVSNMLQFSRPSTTESIPTDLNALLNRTVELAASDFDLKREYDFRSIRIERDYDESLREVPCVSSEMEQVVMNLLRNAAHAMAENTSRAEPPRLILRTRRENGWVRIEIEDNGPGMDDETRRRAFEPFFTTKEVTMGTGLGLSVSYFIVTNNHRGTFEIESQAGEGCRFIIRLPLEQGGRDRSDTHLTSMNG